MLSKLNLFKEQMKLNTEFNLDLLYNGSRAAGCVDEYSKILRTLYKDGYFDIEKYFICPMAEYDELHDVFKMYKKNKKYDATNLNSLFHKLKKYTKENYHNVLYLVFIYNLLSRENKLEINKELYIPIQIDQKKSITASLFIDEKPTIIINEDETVRDFIRLLSLKDIDLYVVVSDGFEKLVAYYVKKSHCFLGELEKRIYIYEDRKERLFRGEIKKIQKSRLLNIDI